MSNRKIIEIKMPHEMDLDLEANMRALNIDPGKSRPKDYVIIEEETEHETERLNIDQNKTPEKNTGEKYPEKKSENKFNDPEGSKDSKDSESNKVSSDKDCRKTDQSDGKKKVPL